MTITPMTLRALELLDSRDRPTLPATLEIAAEARGLWWGRG